MPSHVVVQGECLSSLAAAIGLEAKDLHSHPANSDLRKSRPYPNILAPGDIVEIPEPGRRWEPAPTEKKSVFVLKRPTVKLRIVLLNALGTPYEGKRFVITAGKDELEGTTGADGLIECEVPAQEEAGHLRVWLDKNDPDPHIDRDLEIGHLDPVDLVTGVQARLQNLGFPCTVTGESDEATSLALQRFRARHDLPDGDTAPNPGDAAAAPGNSGAEPNAGTGTTDGGQNDEPAPAPGVEKDIDDAVRAKLQALYEAR